MRIAPHVITMHLVRLRWAVTGVALAKVLSIPTKEERPFLKGMPLARDVS
jgi:hypothetical protein